MRSTSQNECALCFSLYPCLHATDLSLARLEGFSTEQLRIGLRIAVATLQGRPTADWGSEPAWWSSDVRHAWPGRGVSAILREPAKALLLALLQRALEDGDIAGRMLAALWK